MTSFIWELGISCMTITTVYLTGNKSRLAPYMGLLSETAWLTWILTFGHYGLLFLNIVLLILYIRMMWKWAQKSPNQIND